MATRDTKRSFYGISAKRNTGYVLRICGIAAPGGILFGYLSSQFHGAFPMWIFAICCLFSYWFICRFVPETKGVALEHMEEAMLAKRSKTSLSEPVPALPSESK
ncbi:MFS transporter [Yersinia mollaretii]|uniref:MFS transporter n=1 Tax=Yersinia mollaretii TaxID=33060 RepID=UPI0021BDCB6E|nr:MFS transporter [Yersinia mollaretii]